MVVRANHSLECHDSLEVRRASEAADLGRWCLLRPHFLSSPVSADLSERSSSTPEAAAYRGERSHHRESLHGPGGQVFPRRAR